MRLHIRAQSLLVTVFDDYLAWVQSQFSDSQCVNIVK